MKSITEHQARILEYLKLGIKEFYFAEYITVNKGTPDSHQRILLTMLDKDLEHVEQLEMSIEEFKQGEKDNATKDKQIALAFEYAEQYENNKK